MCSGHCGVAAMSSTWLAVTTSVQPAWLWESIPSSARCAVVPTCVASGKYSDGDGFLEEPGMNAPTNRDDSPAPRIGRYRWRICAMVLAATTINYIDRQVLAVLAPELQREIGW